MTTLGKTNCFPKHHLFLSYKATNEFEKYLYLVKNRKHRVALSRLRLSSHQLMIEKGRHRKPILPRPERICPVCEHGIEDECHFVTTCRIYNEARNDLYQVADNLTSNFKEIPTNEQKLIYI